MSRQIRRFRAATMAAALCGAVVYTPVHTAQAEVPAVKRVAMIDMQRVLNETTAGKRARKELETSSQAKQSKLDTRRKKFEADVQKLQSMSGQQLAKAQEKLQQEQMELQTMMYTLQQELGQQHDKLLEKMYRNAQGIVADIAKDEGLDLVLVRDDMTVIYAKDSFDITTRVVKLYDQKYK